MNSIVRTYPGFESLPKGIQEMLMASESHFLKEARRGAAREVLEKTSQGESWKPQMTRSVDGQFAGNCSAWGKQNQVIPILTL